MPHKPKSRFTVSVERLFSLPEDYQNCAVYHTGCCAEHNHRSGYREHPGCHAGNKAFWLCQDRHTKFFEIIWAAHFSVGRFCHGALFGLNQHTHPTDKIGIGTIPLWLIQESQLDSKISHHRVVQYLPSAITKLITAEFDAITHTAVSPKVNAEKRAKHENFRYDPICGCKRSRH